MTLFAVLVLWLVLPTRAAASSSRTTTVNYQTTYRGKTYQKKALVYLPAGYSDQRRYNVLYLLHGSTETTTDFYRDGNFQPLLDRLINSGKMQPTIVIFPTYYQSRRFVSSNYYHDRKLNSFFASHELVTDLIPAVEGRYRTYARGTSHFALTASRNHRAFGGFSMGAVTTWYVFQDDLSVFKSFLPVAGDSWAVKDDGGSVAPHATAKRLAKTAQAHPNLKFSIMAAVGSNDGTAASMTPQIRAMWNLPEFSQHNLTYRHIAGGTHSPHTVARAFADSAGQLCQ